MGVYARTKKVLVSTNPHYAVTLRRVDCPNGRFSSRTIYLHIVLKYDVSPHRRPHHVWLVVRHGVLRLLMLYKKRGRKETSAACL